jgi:deazaflavin-dependent oxidoreductase (nitroreductase family)
VTVQNAVVRGLLRSPLHQLLSGSVLLLTYTGRRTGKTFTIPILYAEDGPRLIVYAGHSEKKEWWRNLRTEAEVRVRVRGADLTGMARVVREDTTARTRYVVRFPRAASALEHDPHPIFVEIAGLGALP